MNQEELQKAFLAFLEQEANSKNIDVQTYAQQLGKEGIKEKFQEFIQMLQQQQSIKAKLGAKLTYYKSLKGSCPEGEELVYFKKGGRICKACQKKAQSMQEGKPMNAVEEFKNKRKVNLDKCGSKMKKKKK